MIRYTLLTLLVVVLVLGLFCAGFANPSLLFVKVIFTLTIVSLLSFTLAGVLSRSRKPFALGFTITGWIYFVFVFGSVVKDHEHLLTDWVLDEFFVVIHFDSDERAGGAADSWDALSDVDIELYRRNVRFMDMGHCLWTLILGTVGGVAAIWLRRPRPPTTD
jgi:hypothetical protein